MGCSACGTENPPEARFCNGCGTPLHAVCPTCDQNNPPASRFCNACGRALASTAVGEPPRTPDSVGGLSYTPRHLAEKILAGREALAGERKQVTVLFADVVGSTALIRDRDPEEAQRLLDGAVARMMEAVHRYEGTVSRLMGDGLMAMFGAPVAHEDHALRACFAALAMLESSKTYVEEARRTHATEVQIRVGLNSGEVVVRLISDDLHMDYTAMGQTVHLASRMEGLANAGTAMLAPSTLALVEGLVDTRPLGPMPIRGLDHPLPVYELTGTGAARTRLQVAAARGLSPFVGRRDERAVIDRAIAQAAAGQGQVVALVGEPGVGKSRLVLEATRSAESAGWLVLASGALSYGTATPYLPIVDIIRSYAGIGADDDAVTMHNRLTERVVTLDPPLDAVLSPLLALLNLPVDDPSWAALDPPRRRRTTLDALRELLLREAQRQPLLLVIEDLHWIDSETQALLDELIDHVPATAIVLLVNYRPEYTHGWANKGAYTQARLDPLAAESAEQLLHAQLGDSPPLDPLKRHLVERTGGNPLFLEESVRGLVETGVLVGSRGAYTLTRDVRDVSMPATVQAILASRIDRLDPEEKRVLQTAAVIGKDVPVRLLQAVAETPAAALQAHLSRLQSAEMLYPIRVFPEPEYTFKHALTHDVAYGGLLQERRKILHGQVTGAIERLYVDRLSEHVEQLAHHTARAETWEQAFAYSHQAGERARSRSAYRAAADHLEQALVALDHLEATRKRTEQAIDIRLSLRSAYRLLGERERVVQRLQEAESLAEALGDQQRLAWTLSHQANFLLHIGEHDRAVDVSERAEAIADRLNDPQLRHTTQTQNAISRWAQGHYREAADRFRRALAGLSDRQILEQTPQSTGYEGIISHANMVWCLAELGEFAEAIPYEARAIRLAEEVGQPYVLIAVMARTSALGFRQGDSARILPRLERAWELCQAHDLKLMIGPTGSRLGAAYAQAERLDNGLSLLELAAAPARGGLTNVEQVNNLIWLGQAYLQAGRLETAAQVAEEALDIALSRKEHGHLAGVHHLRGEIAAHRHTGGADEAAQRYQEALTIAEQLNMRPLQAHCHLGLGKLYRRLGRRAAAHAELSTALAMLREMEMQLWVPETEAELARAASHPVDC